MIDNMDGHIKTLSRFVLDDDKIVTYKWLSKELQVHVNVSKQILAKFWNEHKRNKIVDSTVLLIGTLNDGSMRVEVVKESNLLEAKSKFREILAEHIYSIQKSLPDLELLAIAGEGDVNYSAIKCKESIERSDVELSKIRWGKSFNEKSPQKIAKVKGSSVTKSSPQKDEKVVEQVKEETVEKKTSPENQNSKVLHKKSHGSKKPAQTAKTGFKSLFGKNVKKEQTNYENSFEEEKKICETVPKSDSSTSQTDGNKRLHESGEKKSVLENKTVKSSKTEKSKKQRGKKRNRSEDTKKEHKRIRIISDSDSSISDNNSGAEELPPSPENIPPTKPRSPSPPKEKYEGGKRRILKVKDQVFEEDGFIVTKKVHEYESCSEDEIEVIPPPKETKPLKKSSPTKKTTKRGKQNNSSSKQTTLNNFFKKT
ncbi:DNA polymerase delta subunit 3-like [Prorops nasuta]|uniref:DNA polymerase delta subunit 3-like n=1 Tax=Prorops nasuta TaxID=863751 RepID=UPI0034CD70AD